MMFDQAHYDEHNDAGVQWWYQQGCEQEYNVTKENVTMSSLRTPNANEGKKFDPAPAGWSVARCFAVIDLGTHLDPKWDKETHWVRIGFELPRALRTDGKPFAIYKRYTLSHHEKSRLRIDLESWWGKKFNTQQLNKVGGFDLAKLIDRTAYVNITHSDGDENVFANITALGPLPAEMTCPDMLNKPIFFTLSSFDKAAFEGLSDKTKELIAASGEYKVITGQKAPPPGREQEFGERGESGFDDLNSPPF